MLSYVTPAEAIGHAGLRLVLVRGVPSPWGQAAKTIFEIKRLDYVAAPLKLGGANAEIVAWSGQNSAPVVAWAEERPVTRWDDILRLAERLAPTPSLLPADARQRALMWGFATEICGEGGVGWNCRLQGFVRAVASGKARGKIHPISQALIDKYGFDAAAAEIAPAQIAATLGALSAQLAAQQARGVPYLVGDGLSALDLYWTTFSNLLVPMPHDQCPLSDALRAGFAAREPEILDALDPALLAHRDRIFAAHFRSPMEF
jgi:glutathione S-transferase